jgi:ABC-type glycerol-3-phosphate transport system substrate-binding protein
MEKTMRDDWGIAPLPEYKVYENPEDPDDDTVIKQGKFSAHSIGYCVSVSQKSEVKDEAYAFVNWLATDGQKVLAQKGYISSRSSDKSLSTENLSYKNPNVVMDTIAAAQAGDWWYMPDRGWIDTWAAPLNNQVRYGKMELETFLYSYIEESNKRLAEYKQ